MAIRQNPGMGWLPDIPSVKDYTGDNPIVAQMLARTAVPAIAAAVGVAALPGMPGEGGTALAGTAGAAAAPAISPLIDLRADFSPVEDQQQLGCCTANAAVALLEYFERKALGHHIDASRLFVYKVTRNLLGWTGDTGAYIRTTMEALACFGAPPEKYWPYDGNAADKNTHYEVEPTAFCYAYATNYEALTYYRLDPNGAPPDAVLQNIRVHLAAGYPAMFGFPVYDEFMNLPADHKAAFPKQNSKLYGGHAIVAVGYDDNMMIGPDKGALLIRNSWGPDWGDGGYAWLSYKYVTGGLADDWWTLIRPKWVDSNVFA
jgi:C1A family cysteine protease